MAITDAYTIYQAVLAGAIPVALDGLVSQSTDPGVQRLHRVGAGRRYPSIATEVAARRAATLSTVSISKLLGITGIFSGSLPIATGKTYTSLTLWEAKYDDLAHFASGSVHRKTAFARAMMWLTSLRASQSADGLISPAVADVAVLPVGDGTNDPMQITASQALPTAGTEDGIWTLGPVVINGTAETRIGDWTLSQACQIQPDYTSGGRFPLAAHEVLCSHSVAINFRTPLPLSTYGLGGTAISSNVVLYLQHCSEVGNRVAAATETHIAITIPYGTVTPIAARGSINGDIASGLMVHVVDDGTNPPVSVDVTAALPA